MEPIRLSFSLLGRELLTEMVNYMEVQCELLITTSIMSLVMRRFIYEVFITKYDQP